MSDTQKTQTPHSWQSEAPWNSEEFMSPERFKNEVTDG